MSWVVYLQEIALSIFICLGGEFPRRDIIMSRDVRQNSAGDCKFEGGRLQMNRKRCVLFGIGGGEHDAVRSKVPLRSEGANRIQIGLYHSNSLKTGIMTARSHPIT